MASRYTHYFWRKWMNGMAHKTHRCQYINKPHNYNLSAHTPMMLTHDRRMNVAARSICVCAIGLRFERAEQMPQMPFAPNSLHLYIVQSVNLFGSNRASERCYSVHLCVECHLWAPNAVTAKFETIKWLNSWTWRGAEKGMHELRFNIAQSSRKQNMCWPQAEYVNTRLRWDFFALSVIKS